MRNFPKSQIKQWIRNHRIDLLSTTPPITSAGRFICFEETIPEGLAVMVKGIVPYACQRINVGAADESFQYIAPRDGDGFFCFEPVVNDLSPLDISLKFTTPQVVTPGGTNEEDTQSAKGFTEISDTPLLDALTFWNNPLFSFPVMGGQKLQVIFELLTAVKTASANGLTAGTGTFDIADAAVKRVDFAGCVVVGEAMPESYLHALEEEAHRMRARGLG